MRPPGAWPVPGEIAFGRIIGFITPRYRYDAYMLACDVARKSLFDTDSTQAPAPTNGHAG